MRDWLVIEWLISIRLKGVQPPRDQSKAYKQGWKVFVSYGEDGLWREGLSLIQNNLLEYWLLG